MIYVCWSQVIDSRPKKLPAATLQNHYVVTAILTDDTTLVLVYVYQRFTKRMKPNDVDFAYLSRGLEAFFYGTISVLPLFFPQVAKVVGHLPVSGLYSGIFAMYLQHHASRKDASKTADIVFYALCLLYLLSVATIASDLVDFLIEDVWKNEHLV